MTSMPHAHSSKLARALRVRHLHHVIHVIAHGDKQVEKQLAAPSLHLHLHGPAALEGLAGANDERKVVCAQLGVVIGCVGVGKPCATENDIDLNARLQALLAQSQTLQFIQTKFLRGAIDGSVLEDGAAICCRGCVVENRSVIVKRTARFVAAFEEETVAPLVMQQARRVVAFVQVLQHAAENLRLLVRQLELLGRAVVKLAFERRGEEG